MRALLLTGLLLAGSAGAHRLPNTFITGQRLIDQLDSDVMPKMLYSEEGMFIEHLPPGGWTTNAERARHIKRIDAEIGRSYIHAVWDMARGKQFCFAEKDRPDDETFYAQAAYQLRALPHARLRRDSAAELLVEIWRAKWPCGGGK